MIKDLELSLSYTSNSDTHRQPKSIFARSYDVSPRAAWFHREHRGEIPLEKWMGRIHGEGLASARFVRRDKNVRIIVLQ